MLHTITAGALLKLISDLEPEDLIVFTSDYGDHCHTEQVHPIKGKLEEVVVAPGAYSVSGWVVTDDNDEMEGEETENVYRIK